MRPFGLALCLGCTCLGTGFVAMVVALAFIGVPTSVTSALVLQGLALVGYLPVFVQPHVQRRWFKIPARGMLGAGLALSAAAVLVAAPWTLAGIGLKVGLAVLTALAYRVGQDYRQKNLNNPCKGCPWGAFPLCAHNLPKLRQLRATETDPGNAVFFDVLISQLEPLAVVPPQNGVVPPTPEFPGGVEFIHLRDLPCITQEGEAPPPVLVDGSRLSARESTNVRDNGTRSG
ncbi:MAG: hypothetical protein HY908_34240 [Myxococcales bacterium]|nr:hypothetical protein [Myxococcales bacterium]